MQQIVFPVFAVTYTIDYNTTSDYTFSSNAAYISNGLAQVATNLILAGNQKSGPNNIDRPNQVVVDGDYAYVGSYANGGIQVIDISTPASPVRVGGIAPSNGNRLFGIYDMVLNGDYIYASSRTSSAVVAVNISDPTNPTYSSRVQLTGLSPLSNPTDLYLDGDFLYVASFGSDGLVIIDVSSPGSISHEGSVTSSAQLDKTLGVTVSGNYAYMTSVTKDRFVVIDISDKTTPSIVTEILNNDSTIRLNNVQKIAVSGNYLYTFASPYMQVFDITNPLIPVPGAILTNAGATHLNGVRSVKIVGDYIYAAVDSSDAIEIIDITSPASPSHEGSIRYVNARTDSMVGIDVVGTTIYATSYNKNTVQIIDATDKTSMSFLGEVLAGPARTGGAKNVIIDGDYAYIASLVSNAIEIVDISTPGSPSHAGALTDTTSTKLREPTDLVKVGNYLYVTSSIEGAVAVVNVTDPTNPTYVTAIVNNTGSGVHLNRPESITQQGDYLYVASRFSDALEIIDITDPIVPIHAGSLQDATKLNDTRGIVVDGNYAYMTSYAGDRMQVIDVTNKTSPSLVVGSEIIHNNSTILMNNPSGITKSGDYIYVTGEASKSIQIIDMTDPLSPVIRGNISSSDGAMLNGARGVFVDGDILYVAAYNANAISLIDIADPDMPIQVTARSGTVGAALFGGASGVYKSGNYAYVASYNSNALQVVNVSKKSSSAPYLTTNTAISYVGDISSVAETVGPANQAPIKYQFSKDDGATWYWHNGSTWTSTTGTYGNSNPVSSIQTYLTDFNTLPGTSQLKVKTFLRSNSAQIVEIDELIINDSGSDSLAPTISSFSPGSGSLLPIGNQDFIFSHSDSESGIDIATDILELKKWDGVSLYGANIAATYIDFSGKTVTSTGSIYPLLTNIPYGKYQYTYKISDISGNQEVVANEFYIDEPEFTVSTGSINLGDIDSLGIKFSPSLTVTVKTVGAGFNITMNTATLLTEGTGTIPDWDGTLGYGYDQSPFSGSLTTIGSNQNISTNSSLINTNGNKNIYIYNIKLGAITDELSIGGDYDGSIDFGINFNY